MAQDTDVARVAAALRAPGIRYRSFGNEPVRTAATSAAGEFSLLGAGIAAAADVAAQQGLGQAQTPEAWPTPSYAAPAWPEPPPPVAWPVPEARRQDPAPPSWAEPAQPAWTESSTPSWASVQAAEPPVAASAAWAQPEPTAAAWPAPAPATPWPSEPTPPAAESFAAWATPAAAPAWTPAPAPAPAAPPIEVGPPPLAAPTVAATPMPAAPRELSLLTAAASLVTAGPRPALSTLVALSTPPPAIPAFGHAVPQRVAASPFPLIDALDLPGGFGGSGPVLRAGPPPVVVAPTPVGPLPAATVNMPLAELFALLARGPAPPEPAFALLRGHPPRVLGH